MAVRLWLVAGVGCVTAPAPRRLSILQLYSTGPFVLNFGSLLRKAQFYFFFLRCQYSCDGRDRDKSRSVRSVEAGRPGQ